MPEKITGSDGKPIKIKRFQRVYNPGPGYNASGLFNLSGQFQNPDEIGVDTYEKMLDTDVTCQYAFEILTLAVLSRLGEYTHKNKQITEFVHKQFERISGSIYWVVEEILNALWAGFSLGEIVFDYIENKVSLVDIQFIRPSIASFNLHTEGIMKNRVKEVVLTGSLEAGIDKPVSIEKFILYTHRKRFGNPYGVSRFKAVYPIYHIKMGMMASWAKAQDRYGSPPAVARVDGDLDEEVSDPGGEVMSYGQYITGFMNSLQAGSSITLPANIELDFPQLVRSIGQDFDLILRFCDKMFFRAFLMPSLVADNSDKGAFAQSKTHFKTFLFSLDKLKLDVSEVLLDQLIRKIVEWNFGAQEEWGEFQHKDFDPETGEIFSKIFAQVTEKGYLTPELYEDLRYVRETLGMPGISKADWKQWQELKAKRQAEFESRLDEKRKDLKDESEAKDSKGKEEKGNKSSKVAKKKSEENEKMTALLNGVQSFLIEL